MSRLSFFSRAILLRASFSSLVTLPRFLLLFLLFFLPLPLPLPLRLLPFAALRPFLLPFGGGTGTGDGEALGRGTGGGLWGLPVALHVPLWSHLPATLEEVVQGQLNALGCFPLHSPWAVQCAFFQHWRSCLNFPNPHSVPPTAKLHESVQHLFDVSAKWRHLPGGAFLSFLQL